MKIEKIICDRCGAEVIYPCTRKIFLSQIGKEGGLDLCDNCHSEINTWFVDKRKSDVRIEALSFLSRLMLRQGETKHEMPEYFEDDFYTLLKNYQSLNEYILKFYEEGKETIRNEKK